ncbi:DUF4365 domain-containing protein [Longispora albida]|uniref:DUF4365 domain-containing protein n=1 Tax=Longispora albida TaxID=203523 RepID=UPI00036BD2A4|nr:DUF4365 domain-containing protein [Longispora albida]
MPLHPNVHQGLHGEGFVHALASAAGLVTSRLNIDVLGIDWLIACPDPVDGSHPPMAEFQVKSSSRERFTDGKLSFQLKTAHFNHLAGAGRQRPRFLAVVLVPPKKEDYAECTDDAMELARAAYWVSLADREPIPLGDQAPATVSVTVYQRNRLTVNTLTSLMSGDLEGAVL